MNTKKQRGFMMASTVFIVVVLSLISSFIVSISTLSRNSENLSLMGAKVYFAAKSGLEWAAFQVRSGAGPYVCPSSPATLNLNQGALSGLTVVVSCHAISFTEDDSTYNIFELSAVSDFSTPGTADYVKRQLNTVVIQPGV
jgi:MSHA biogenesis protein MshP